MGIIVSPSALVDIDYSDAGPDDVLVVIFTDEQRLCLGVTEATEFRPRRPFIIPELAPEAIRQAALRVAQQSLAGSKHHIIAGALGVDSIAGMTPEGLLYELSLYYLEKAWLAGPYKQSGGSHESLNVGNPVVVHFHLLERGWNASGPSHITYQTDTPVGKIEMSDLPTELMRAAARLPLQ